MTTQRSPQEHGVIDSATWTYRIAQNPRPAGLVISAFMLAIAVMLLSLGLGRPGEHEIVWILVGTGFLGISVLWVILSGYTNLSTPRALTGEATVIRSSGALITVAGYAMLLGFGMTAFLEAFDRTIDPRSSDSPVVFVIIGIILIGAFLWSLILAGWHRRLIFTPGALHYERGRFFTATLPWDAMTDLTPVCDANIGDGGPGSPEKPSRWNLRAGVRVIPGDAAQIRGKTMLKEHRGRLGVGIDCSSYRIDANTLINAIYLLVENPELRPLLARPEGAVLFEGPSWKTRARMKVGDRWDRTTDRVIAANPTLPENR